MGSGEKRPSMRRKSAGGFLFDVANHAFLVLLCLSIVYPFWTTILLSFAEGKESGSLGFHIWLDRWNLQAYRFAFSRYGNVGVAYMNSVFRTVAGTFVTILFTMLGAYPLSKRGLPGRRILTMIMLITMFFSGGLIPLYLLIRSLGLFDSRWALILPLASAAYYIVIARNFLMTIDDAYEEAAFMDGAGYLQVFVRIIVPLSKPVIATIALWAAVRHWNAWFDALIYTKSESKIVLQVLLRRLIQELSTVDLGMQHNIADEGAPIPSSSVMAAVTVLTIGPIVLVYPFLQKYFMKGIFVGSLKG